jgi:Ca2+-binding RTX toxin-like protein
MSTHSDPPARRALALAALTGADGAETFIGSAGNDFVDGNIGADAASAADTFQRDPSDGSDSVEGQGGKDNLAFNGSNAPENIDVTANGSRVRLFRNVAAITMDLNDIESTSIRALGAADTITVGDLRGTDLDAANVDLTAGTGDGNGAADTGRRQRRRQGRPRPRQPRRLAGADHRPGADHDRRQRGRERRPARQHARRP